MDSPQQILVINVTRIGDTLAATPAINALHERWPLARIDILGSPHHFQILENLPGVVDVSAITKNRSRFRGWLRAKKYDLALVYNYDEPLVWYALRIAKRVVAFRQKTPALNQRLFRCVDPNAYVTNHITEHFLKLATALDIHYASGRIVYRCTPSEVDDAQQRLRNRGFATKRPLVGLQVASFPTKTYRDWPIESFHELCRRVLARWPQAGFLIYGGPAEQQRTHWLKQQLGDSACLFAGQLSLRETAAVMSLTDLYVGVDTGPTHLMSNFDIPIIGLYHPRHPAKDLGPKNHPLNFSLDHPHDDDLNGEPRSMSDISVARVFEQVEKTLATRGIV